MTEKEAIDILLQVPLYRYECDIEDHRRSDLFNALSMAIKALEEIQQYRELEHKLNGVDLKMLVNHWMEVVAEGEVQGYQRGRILTNEDADKWDAYRAIGTPEECRAAVDKQKAKKIVRVKLRQSEWGSEYRCPVCESDLIKTVFFNEDGTEPDEKISWCSGCGQKLDWSGEDDD